MKDGNAGSDLSFIDFVGADRWRLRVWVQPRAKKDECMGVYQDCLKIRLRAPAADNKANQALCRFLASKLGLRKAAVELSNGQTSRKKTIYIVTRDEPDWTLLTE
jgi:hypothetical protein